MATDYTLKGIGASIAPYEQKWRRVAVDTDHAGRVLYAGNEEIDLLFDSCSITFARQWLEAASGGSLNMTVLNRYKLGYTDLSAVQLRVNEWPAIQAGVSGPWTMTVTGASGAW
jgi:hypothetical protein